MGASLSSENTFHCTLGAQGALECVEGAHWESVHYGHGRRAPAWSFESVTARLFKQCYARAVQRETVGLLIGHVGLLLGLRCDARDSCVHFESLRRSFFELSGDNPECFGSALAGLVGLGPARPGQRS